VQEWRSNSGYSVVAEGAWQPDVIRLLGHARVKIKKKKIKSIPVIDHGGL
jgi:hypothetical protein